MDERIGTAEGPNDTRVYLVEGSPADLPPVRSGDLKEVWLEARRAAELSQWSEPRLIRFKGDAEQFDLLLADDDACCWIGAVDRYRSLATRYGLSLCLRLLSLISLIGQAWATPQAEGQGRTAIEPALIRLAAVSPLTERGELDELWLRRQLHPSHSPHAGPGATS